MYVYLETKPTSGLFNNRGVIGDDDASLLEAESFAREMGEAGHLVVLATQHVIDPATGTDKNVDHSLLPDPLPVPLRPARRGYVAPTFTPAAERGLRGFFRRLRRST